LRLARYFNSPPEFWMRLQMDYDLEMAADSTEAAVRQEIRPRPVAHRIEEADERAIA
jgi:plasmid maintenance system antidote protein VapI